MVVRVARDSLQKELQRVASLVALDRIHQDIKQSSQGDLWAKMGVLFHGEPDDEDSIALVDSVINGYGYFAELWEKKPLANNEEGNEFTEGGFNLVLKSSISYDTTTNYISKQAFTIATLRKKSKNSQLPVSGRALFDAAKDSWKELKKAYVFANDFMPDGSLPSGKTLEDLFVYVRKGMYAHYYAKKPPAVVIDGDPDEVALDTGPSAEELAKADVYVDVDAVVLPSPSWTYLGWACFVCFHPLSSNFNQLSILSVVDLNTGEMKEKKKKSGRAAAREEEQKRSADSVAGGAGGSPFKKTLKGGATRKDIARIAMKDDQANEQHEDRKMMALTALTHSKNLRADRLFHAMVSAPNETARKLYSDMYDKENGAITTLEACLAEIKDAKRVWPQVLEHFLAEMVPGAGSNATASANATTSATNNTRTTTASIANNTRSSSGDDSESDPLIGGIISTRLPAAARSLTDENNDDGDDITPHADD
jgi:hypothetical protein